MCTLNMSHTNMHLSIKDLSFTQHVSSAATFISFSCFMNIHQTVKDDVSFFSPPFFQPQSFSWVLSWSPGTSVTLHIKSQSGRNQMQKQLRGFLNQSLLFHLRWSVHTQSFLKWWISTQLWWGLWGENLQMPVSVRMVDHQVCWA